MSFSALAKAAIENGQQDHVKYIVAAAMEYYLGKIGNAINDTVVQDGVFLSAALIAANAGIEQSLGPEGIEARDTILKDCEIETIDLATLMREYGNGEESE